MIDDYSNQHSEDPFADVHAGPIVQVEYSDPIAARISDASTQIYSTHHRHMPESKDSAYLASDYDIATALLDLRRQVRISSKTSSVSQDNVSTTFPSTSVEFPGPPIQRTSTSHSHSAELHTPLSSMNEGCAEGSGEFVKMKSSSEMVKVDEDVPLSPVSVVRKVEVRVIFIMLPSV